ncbi:hypothetical protein MGMO_125c00020 [Methyloglobulus morosus KoM1]|uniref:Uncharacterized protein n=1 Tax=Methyloglobulus morosus KoM1 TaxID=1116472 RepID=V5C021_9GAMM|nr:hypothetical protein [Methyloglobulus morosus]ESS70128.1 hypothetical protein MGMO_125c00020 [Methyloglobulus morosus KoM1]
MFLINNVEKIITWFVLLFALLSFYDTLLDLLLWLLHSIVVLLHTLFEFTEHALDLLIEHIFHTGPRTTEITVFYLMLTIYGSIAFRLLKTLTRWYSRFVGALVSKWHHEKENALTYWQNQPSIEKFKFGSIFMASTAIMFLWIFS